MNIPNVNSLKDF